MSILSIVQCRMTSTRLPGKVLMEIGGKPILQWVVEALPEPRVVATSTDESDRSISEWCLKNQVQVSCGPLDDVLGRFYRVASRWRDRPGWILRACADSPMLTRQVVEDFIKGIIGLSARYDQNGYIQLGTFDKTTIYTNRPWDPDGYDLELFSFDALKMAHENATDPYDREHVTPWLYRHLSVVRFSLFGRPPGPDRPEDKVSVDTIEDLEKVRKLLKEETK